MVFELFSGEYLENSSILSAKRSAVGDSGLLIIRLNKRVIIFPFNAHSQRRFDLKKERNLI